MKINPNVHSYSSSSVAYRANISKPVKIGFSNLDRISSEAEYDRIMDGLKNNNKWSSWWSRGNKFEQGIMPYAGEEDISRIINTFLYDNEIGSYSKFDKRSVEAIIRILDYALQELDKIYGKFEGFVYRSGVVKNMSKNFVSTSREPFGAADLYNDVSKENRCKSTPFYIINTKNGHKIEEIQKKLNYNPAYICETEILLGPTNFKEPVALTPEMRDAKEKLFECFDKHHYRKPAITFLEEV